MVVTYNAWLVALSYLIAVIASFTALDLGSRVTLSTGRAARAWLIGGAVAMGVGIWSMHFVGMLAFHLGVPLAYDVPITLLSLLPAVATSALALAAIRRGNAGWRAVTWSALAMGGGIVAMHYTGMAAIVMQPPFEYDLLLVAASALIAVAASYAALHIAFRTRAQTTANVIRPRIGAALVMGAAICGMHYTGMAATEFIPGSICLSSPLGVDPAWLAGMVGGGSFLMLAMTLITSVLDARLGDQNARMAAELQRANAELQARAEALAEKMTSDLRLRGLAIESSVNGVLIVNHRDPDCPIEYANPALRRITGYSAAEIIGRNFLSLLRTHGDGAAIATVRESLRTHREVRVLMRNCRKDGSLFWNDLFIAPVLDDAGAMTHSVMIVHDVSAAIAHQEELHRLANYDALTGLPNRVLFGERLARVITDAEPEQRAFVVLFVDVDQFKFINDSLGHTAGDELLRCVATRLVSCLRDNDIIARLGGDEFVIVLTALLADDDVVATIVDRLLATVAEPVTIAGHELRITCSIGVSRFPDDGLCARDLLKNADAAMYLAKRNGRNNVQNFTRDLSCMIDERVLLQSSLHGALERGELLLHYHPQIDLVRGRMIGLEALLRWNHPERGLTSPGAFIALAEETGVIVPIGEWVLRTACRQMILWDRAGLPPLTISINVSVRQLQQKGLVEMVAATLRETGLPPGRLELELTESLLARDADDAVGILYALRSLGVRLAIDDFGTGYSSLGYLKRLPISRLKIDQSFIRGIHNDAGNAAIARTIITLGESLGLEVLAEGVETAAERDWLRDAGCELAQGYLFSRPVAASDVGDLVKNMRFVARRMLDAAA